MKEKAELLGMGEKIVKTTNKLEGKGVPKESTHDAWR
jgi:hypothetical protein